MRLYKNQAGLCPTKVGNKILWSLPYPGQKCKSINVNTGKGKGKGNNDTQLHTLNNWTGNQILIPELGLDLIGMGAIATLMFIGIISLPIALVAIAIFAILSYFLTKDIEQKIKNFINNLLQNFFHIPYGISKIIADFVLDAIGVLIALVVIYIIYLKEK